MPESSTSERPNVFDYLEGTSPNAPGERGLDTGRDTYFSESQGQVEHTRDGGDHSQRTEAGTKLTESLLEAESVDAEQCRQKEVSREAESYYPPEDDSQSLPEDLTGRKKAKRRSKRDSDLVDVDTDESNSVAASAPAVADFYEGKKSKRRSKRDSGGFDDTISVVTLPAKVDDTKESKRKSKDKKSSGGLFGLFGSGRSDDSLAKKRDAKDVPAEATYDDFEEPRKKSKRKSKDRQVTEDAYDVYSVAAQSVSDLSQTGKPRTEDEGQADELPGLEKLRGREERRRGRYEDIVDAARNEPKVKRHSSKVTGAQNSPANPLSGKTHRIPR